VQQRSRLEDVFRLGFDPTPSGRYLPWDQLRRRPPPEGLSPEEWWLGVKLARGPLLKDLPLADALGRPIKYAAPDPVPERLQRIDRDAGGQILLSEDAPSAGHRDRYVVSSLVEESIMSSLLEGAATTRREAKEMIREGRKPSTKGERMVMNNFRAMQQVKTLLGEPLSADLIRSLHRTLGEGALDTGTPGEFRGPDPSEQWGVWSGDRRLYVPPPPEAVPGMIEQACAFANGTDGPYVHPVVKAVALHFWIGFVHPFEDGNGRVARALFYWSMLREQYWLFEFVSISRVLKDSFAKYGRAYLYTETDDNDLTYFLLFHLDVIDRALDDVQAYIRRKARELRETRAVLHPSSDLNHRQIALLRHALDHPDAVYTIRSHQTSHGVVYQTARTDLLGLTQRGLLVQGKRGRALTFRVPADLSERVREGDE
jgi:Fic family protein